LEGRIKRLEERASTVKDVPPEVAAVLEAAKADPEYLQVVDAHRPHLEAIEAKLENGDGLPDITPEEEQAVARTWDTLQGVAMRIARQRGIPFQDVLRALVRGGEAYG